MAGKGVDIPLLERPAIRGKWIQSSLTLWRKLLVLLGNKEQLMPTTCPAPRNVQDLDSTGIHTLSHAKAHLHCKHLRNKRL